MMKINYFLSVMHRDQIQTIKHDLEQEQTFEQRLK
jgi:hypothetical protein